MRVFLLVLSIAIGVSAAEKVSTNAPSLKAPGWEALFDGKTLKGWKETDFAGRGEVKVKDGQIIMEMGVMTGITRTNPVLRMNYEISVEAMRVDGGDFFCGLTFPVDTNECSLIVGGWGGGVVGLSSLDSNDASSNETTQYINFQKGKWYLIQLRVTPGRIQAWLDGDSLIDVDTKGKMISIRSEMDESVPLGVATWATTGALKNFKLRKL
ncbi:MAG TPA: DUF1080 domain-containing protein [Verrucomicrobiae bacterium]|nr:DUF1080 domain-containing protein [Verrucomicrobiae bacterium]